MTNKYLSERMNKFGNPIPRVDEDYVSRLLDPILLPGRDKSELKNFKFVLFKFDDNGCGYVRFIGPYQGIKPIPNLGEQLSTVRYLFERELEDKLNLGHDRGLLDMQSFHYVGIGQVGIENIEDPEIHPVINPYVLNFNVTRHLVAPFSAEDIGLLERTLKDHLHGFRYRIS